MKGSPLKSLLILLILFCCFFRIEAQSFSNDSIKSVLKNADLEDSISTFTFLHNEFFNNKRDSSLYYAKRAFELGSKAKQLKSKPFLISGYVNILNATGSASKVIQILDSLELNSELPSDLAFKARTLEQRGVAFKKLGKYKEGLESLIAAAELYAELEDQKSIGDIYYSIGELMREQKQYPEALEYFQKSERIYSDLGIEYSSLKVKNGMGIILMENGRPDSGLVVLKSILDALDPQKDSVFMGITYQNIGLAHMNANRYDSAMENLYKAEAIKKAQNNRLGLLFTNNSIADIHQKQGNDELGLSYLYKNLDILTEIDQLHQLRNTVWKLSAIYESLGKFDSAYFYLKEAKMYSDSLLNEENLQDRLRLIGSYDAKLKEKENLSLKSEIQSKDRWILYVVIFSILLFTAIVFIYLYYRQKNRLTRKLIIQNKELKILNEEINNLVGIIAHDLKAPLNKIEGLTSILTMEGDLNSSQKDILEKIRKVNTNGKALIKDLVEINQIEYSQSKIEASDRVELSQVLKEISDSYQTKAAQKEIEIILSIEKEIHVKIHLEYLKRILDNLISNSLKFSEKNKKVYITLTTEKKLPVIEIKDEGPGISVEDQAKMFRKFQKLSAQPTGGEHSIGLGLSIVKLLSDRLGIDIEVDSKLGVGTTFYLIFR